MELIIQNVSKRYDKEKYGLNNFSLIIGNGIMGLLGPNGAGKSTIMKILATISGATSGSITLDGVDIGKSPEVIRKTLGYLPQDFGVYPNLNAYEFLTYIAAMKGVGGKNLKPRIEKLLEGVNLSDAAKRPIGTYSGGMKQRIGIAQVLLNDPKILIFDEPTVGLDPEERVRFRNLISDLAQDSIVILSSHIVSDIETIADEVAIMKSGTLITKGSQEQVISVISDKVFEIEIDHTWLSAFTEKYMVIDTIRKKEKVKVRFISPERMDHAKQCSASLEDAYLFMIKSSLV